MTHSQQFRMSVGNRASLQLEISFHVPSKWRIVPQFPSKCFSVFCFVRANSNNPKSSLLGKFMKLRSVATTFKNETKFCTITGSRNYYKAWNLLNLALLDFKNSNPINNDSSRDFAFLIGNKLTCSTLNPSAGFWTLPKCFQKNYFNNKLTGTVSRCSSTFMIFFLNFIQTFEWDFGWCWI